MRYFVTIGSRTLEVELGARGLRVDGDEMEADLVELDGTQVRSLLLGGRSHRVLAGRTGRGGWNLYLSGRHLSAEVVDERTRSIREMTGQKEDRKGPEALRAPMPGLVVKVEVGEGEEVFPGQGLVIVEAMKMENELKSEGHLRVTRVGIAAGDAVEKNQVLVEFESV
ncbi:acetyl-CoA carboxylase biotin carboxyl carrier protein subunit [Gemmatimonadota bacterium]